MNPSVGHDIECIDLDDSEPECEPPPKVARLVNGLKTSPADRHLTNGSDASIDGQGDATDKARGGASGGPSCHSNASDGSDGSDPNKEVLLKQLLATCVNKWCAHRLTPLGHQMPAVNASGGDPLIQTLTQLKARSEERVRTLAEALNKRRQTLDKETQTNVNLTNGLKNNRCGDSDQQLLNYALKLKKKDLTIGQSPTETKFKDITDTKENEETIDTNGKETKVEETNGICCVELD